MSEEGKLALWRGAWCVAFHRKHYRWLSAEGDWVTECCDKCREYWTLPRYAARTTPPASPNPLT